MIKFVYWEGSLGHDEPKQGQIFSKSYFIAVQNLKVFVHIKDSSPSIK